MSDYDTFLRSKAAIAPATGLPNVPPLGDYLFPFQKDLVRWALKRGKAALFCAVGSGKTRMQLEFASQASAYLDAIGEPSDVLILTPLAVAAQTVREAGKIGMQAKYCKDPSEAQPGSFTVTNYDRLERFNPKRYGVIVLDESSVLKHQDSKTRDRIIAAFKETPFRLACTATPAPNDRKELGNHAEFLGVMSMQEMLSEFFVHDSGKTSAWRLKGHAEEAFWGWVASWGAMVTKPSDLGYDDSAYNLPPLHIHDHVIGATIEQDREVGAISGHAQLNLIPMPARSLKAQRKARRVTLEERVNFVVEIVVSEPDEDWLIWCELNDEADATEKMICEQLGSMSVVRQVTGSDSGDFKADTALWFSMERCRCEPVQTKKEEDINANTCENTQSAQTSSRRNSRKKTIETQRVENSTPQIQKEERGPAKSRSGGRKKTQDVGSLSDSKHMGSLQTTTIESSQARVEDAQSAAEKSQSTSLENSTSTIATGQESSEVSFAHRATSDSASSRTILTDSKARCSICGLSTRGRVLVSKSSIFGFGLNLQVCARSIFVGVSHKFEEVHQALGRNHRFGQKREVHAHFVYSELEGDVRANLARKQREFTEMAEKMRGIVAGYVQENVRGAGRTSTPYNPTMPMTVATWVTSGP